MWIFLGSNGAYHDNDIHKKEAHNKDDLNEDNHNIDDHNKDNHNKHNHNEDNKEILDILVLVLYFERLSGVLCSGFYTPICSYVQNMQYCPARPLVIAFNLIFWNVSRNSRIRETLNLSPCADSSTDTIIFPPFSYRYIYIFLIFLIIIIIIIRCQVSRVTCCALHVNCHLSHVNNINRHGPSPCQLPHYAQQNAATDLDLYQSTMRHKDRKNLFFF